VTVSPAAWYPPRPRRIGRDPFASCCTGCMGDRGVGGARPVLLAKVRRNAPVATSGAVLRSRIAAHHRCCASRRIVTQRRRIATHPFTLSASPRRRSSFCTSCVRGLLRSPTELPLGCPHRTAPPPSGPSLVHARASIAPSARLHAAWRCGLRPHGRRIGCTCLLRCWWVGAVRARACACVRAPVCVRAGFRLGPQRGGACQAMWPSEARMSRAHGRPTHLQHSW
jgi:hypothetical protein